MDLEAAGGGGERLELTRIKAGMKEGVPALRGFATKYVEREFAQREGVGTSAFAASGSAPSFAIVGNASSASRLLDDGTPTAPPGYVTAAGGEPTHMHARAVCGES